MSRGVLILPVAGFAIAFLATVTLQPAVGSFSRAYRFDGGVQVASASGTWTPTPEHGVFPITLTPARAAILRPGQPSPTSSAAATRHPDASSTARPGETRVASPTVNPSSSATAVRTATLTAGPSATAAATATSSPTVTPPPAATPDPCGRARGAKLVFSPATQTLTAADHASGKLALKNEGAAGNALDLVVRVSVVAGREHLKGLRFPEFGPEMDVASGALELRPGDLAPGEPLALAFEAALSWTGPGAATANARPAIELRFDVVADACRPSASTAPAAIAAARVVIQAGPLPVAIRTTPVAAASDALH